MPKQPEIHEHWADDPDVTFEAEQRNWMLFAFALAALFAGAFMFTLLFTPEAPPVVTFPAPRAPEPAWDFFHGFTAECLVVDGDTMTIKPNWDSKYCSPEAAKKRGEW